MPSSSRHGGAVGRSRRDENVSVRIYDGKIIKRLMKYAIPYWYLFAGGLILILIISASTLSRPYLVKMAIDGNIQKAVSGEMTASAASNGVKQLGLIFLLLIIVEFVFGYVQNYLLESAGKKIIYNLRNSIFKHVQSMPVSYFDKNPIGRIVTRVTNDTDALNEMYTDVIVSLIKDLFMMAGILIIMFSLSVKLTIMSMLIAPLMVVATVFFRKKARRVFGEIRTKLATINAFLSEHISGMRLIQAFNMQGKKLEEFKKINADYRDANYGQIVIFGVFRPFMDIVSSLALALLLWFGGRGILRDTLELGTLFAFINYINWFFQPIMDLTEQYNTLQASMVASDRIFSLLDEEIEKEPVDKRLEMRKIKGMIEFKNVWFAYVDESWVLKDISFKIMPGEAVAFVGATGAGKTSIINLICGFYEIQRGEIFVDGINIKNISKKDLRVNIGLVLQDVFLFSGDIETNIRLFNSEISSEKVKAAAEAVNADYFINRLPKGYKSEVNEKGSTLSSGQRQLLSFSRALICDPRILVMDEATSNIDTETEVLIQDALSKLMKGRTSISIAHRLSTIQSADKIIVMHKGKICEMGNHQELLENEGLYYNLYRLQYNDRMGQEVV